MSTFFLRIPVLRVFLSFFFFFVFNAQVWICTEFHNTPTSFHPKIWTSVLVVIGSLSPVLVLKWFPYSCVIISCSVHFFLFFPLLTAWSLEETLFPQKKKSDSRLHRQKATTARMGLWDELSNRQVGLFVSDYSKRDVSATGKFKIFWKDLQHLCGVCLVRKTRTFFCLFSLPCCWLMSRLFFPQMMFLFYTKR